MNGGGGGAMIFSTIKGEQWLSSRVLDSRPRGRGFEPRQRHCVMVLKSNKQIIIIKFLLLCRLRTIEILMGVINMLYIKNIFCLI